MNSNYEYLASVLVPAYNHERYILESLEGLANQSFKDFQIIVTDDHSTDRTPEILKDNQEKYGYELILNNVNVGISASLTNMAKNYARGKYLFICASDDIYMPDRIEKQVQFMEDNPQYGMCYARTIRMDYNSNIIGRDNKKCYRSGYIFEDLFLRKYNIGICVAIKADVLDEVGYYKPELMAEDYYMNCKIAEKYEIGFIDDYLLKYRVAALNSKRDPLKLIQSHRLTIDYFSYRPEYKDAIRNWEIRSAVLLSPFKRYKKEALKYLLNNLFRLSDKQNLKYSLYTFCLLLLKWE